MGEWWAVEHEGELVGYCCFGADARVPGVEPEEDTLDVGYGMRPELMGRGLRRSFVSAVLRFAAAERVRLLILDWNARSRSLAARLGFEEVGSVVSGGDRYVIHELQIPITPRP